MPLFWPGGLAMVLTHVTRVAPNWTAMPDSSGEPGDIPLAAKRWWVALALREVESFMAADKVVPADQANGTPRRMAWKQPSPTRYLFRAPIEVAAALVGELILFVNPNFERSWFYKLNLHDEEVFRWDMKPKPSGHNNPRRGCPAGFPRKVRAPEHEHIWVPSMNCDCAVALNDVDTSTHERMFVEFCGRTKLAFGPSYVAPTPQPRLL